MKHGASVFLLGLGFSVAVGCGDDQPAMSDASTDAAADASTVDAGPDAFNPCPGKTTFEVGVVDWVSGENLAGITVTEGNTANAANSAPNGRVLLCIANTGPVTIRFTDGDYLDRVHSTTAEIAAEQYAAGAAPSFRMLSTAQATTLYASVTETYSGTSGTVIAMVRNRSNGAELSGVTVELGVALTHKGAFIPGGDVNTLVSGGTTNAGGRVLFVETDTDPATIGLTASGASNCAHAPAVSLVGGSISSVSIVCDP